MTASWDWPARPTLTLEEEFSSRVSAYEAAAEPTAEDNRDYRFFLLFVWIGGLVYLGFFVLGVWKLAEVIGGLL